MPTLNHASAKKGGKRSVAFWDLLILAGLAVAVIVLLFTFDTTEIVDWLSQYSETTIDEIIVGSALLAVFFGVFAYRRWREVNQELVKRKRVQSDLKGAEAATRAKSEFLANMSHEIRTPLNGVIGMVDLALETNLTDEQRDYLETARSSGYSLLRVINDILDFSRIEAGKLELDNIDFNLRDSLADALMTLGLRAEQKGLELAYEVAPDVPEAVIGDPG